MALLPYLFNERPFRVMDREIFGPNFNHMVPQQISPWRNVFHPWEDMFRQMEQLSSTMHQMALRDSNISSNSEKFQINVDVQHFAPEEISVKVVDGFVTVEGKHEEKQDEHGYISRQFVRRYALPQGCLPDTVESKLSSDGVLTVTAPKVLPLPSTGERIVPITHTGPVKKQIGPAEGNRME